MASFCERENQPNFERLWHDCIQEEARNNAIGVTVDDDDLVQTVVDGLPSSWETFMASINGRETQTTFERLWHDCIEEEGRV